MHHHTKLDNDIALVAQFRRGDREAFRLIYEEMVKPLLGFTSTIVYSISDAEDIVANTFYKLFKFRESFTSLDHIRRWCYVTAKHECIDYFRARKRLYASGLEIHYLTSEAMENIETERVKSLLLSEILDQMEKLSKQRGAVLKMYFFEEKTTSEIAEKLVLTTQTVLNHKTKALEMLRKTIQEPAKR